MQASKELSVPTVLTYRPDVDGLRAVAVLGVLAYHLGAFRAYGGFVGVDVFFVISGYLISSVILRDIERSRFSLLAFYERRIRRILPALVVMMLITASVCSRYQLPSQMPGTALSLIAATFSLSNIYFLLATVYFPHLRSEPFAPTWSLAVEEQFYILFPLFLMFLRRYLPGRMKAAVFTVAALSFALSAVGVYLFPSASFYLPITRAWELLLGTMLAMNIFPRIDSALLRNLTAFTGLAGILLCVFTYSPQVRFPGVAALAPCLGAALVIAGGETGPSLVSRALSLKPVVFLGLISYSLYLWHVPIMLFQRLGVLQVSGASNHIHILRIATMLVSILVATLSWKFVETPFRTGRWMLQGRSAFAFAAVSAAVLTVLGLSLAVHGLPFRHAPRELALSASIRTAAGPSASCFMAPGAATSQPRDAGNFLTQNPSRRADLFVSHSDPAHLEYGMRKRSANPEYMQTTSGCESLVAERAALPFPHVR